MNAKFEDAPVRPDPRAVVVAAGEPRVIVTLAWFDANEGQVRHLTRVAIDTERERRALEEKLADKMLEAIELADKLKAAQESIAVAERGRMVWLDEAARLKNEINTPETADFVRGLRREAAHQREKWATEIDAAKTPEDWFWLVGFLSGKACRYFAIERQLRELVTPDLPDAVRLVLEDKAAHAYEKGVHHTITTAAALANWHLNVTGADQRMAAGREFQIEEEPEPLYRPLQPADAQLREVGEASRA